MQDGNYTSKYSSSRFDLQSQHYPIQYQATIIQMNYHLNNILLLNSHFSVDYLLVFPQALMDPIAGYLD